MWAGSLLTLMVVIAELTGPLMRHRWAQWLPAVLVIAVALIYEARPARPRARLVSVGSDPGRPGDRSPRSVDVAAAAAGGGRRPRRRRAPLCGDGADRRSEPAARRAAEAPSMTRRPPTPVRWGVGPTGWSTITVSRRRYGGRAQRDATAGEQLVDCLQRPQSAGRRSDGAVSQRGQLPPRAVLGSRARPPQDDPQTRRRAAGRDGAARQARRRTPCWRGWRACTPGWRRLTELRAGVASVQLAIIDFPAAAGPRHRLRPRRGSGVPPQAHCRPSVHQRSPAAGRRRAAARRSRAPTHRVATGAHIKQVHIGPAAVGVVGERARPSPGELAVDAYRLLPARPAPPRVPLVSLRGVVNGQREPLRAAAVVQLTVIGPCGVGTLPFAQANVPG